MGSHLFSMCPSCRRILENNKGNIFQPFHLYVYIYCCRERHVAQSPMSMYSLGSSRHSSILDGNTYNQPQNGPSPRQWEQWASQTPRRQNIVGFTSDFRKYLYFANWFVQLYNVNDPMQSDACLKIVETKIDLVNAQL